MKLHTEALSKGGRPKEKPKDGDEGEGNNGD